MGFVGTTHVDGWSIDKFSEKRVSLAHSSDSREDRVGEQSCHVYA